MPITFPCPNPKCRSHLQRQKLTAKEEQVGRTLPCPACKTHVTVPAAEVVAWFQSQKLKVGEKDEMGDTLMHNAASAGRIDCMKYLATLKPGEIHARNNNKETPIFWAAMLGKIESILCLAELGAYIEASDKSGMTPLCMAAAHGQTESMKCLKKLGAAVNAKDDDSLPPIIAAITAGQLASVKCLKELGARLNLRNDRGGTLDELASMLGHTEIAKWLCANSTAAKSVPVQTSNQTLQDSRSVPPIIPYVPPEIAVTPDQFQSSIRDMMRRLGCD